MDSRPENIKNVTFYCIGTTSEKDYNEAVYFGYGDDIYLTLARWQLVDGEGVIIANSENTDWYWNLNISGNTNFWPYGGDGIRWDVNRTITVNDCTLLDSQHGSRYVYNGELVDEGLATSSKPDAPTKVDADSAVLFIKRGDTDYYYMIDMSGERILYHDEICNAWGLVTERQSTDIAVISQPDEEPPVAEVTSASYDKNSGGSATIVCNYDRGWDVEPTCREAEMALCILLNNYN